MTRLTLSRRIPALAALTATIAICYGIVLLTTLGQVSAANLTKVFAANNAMAEGTIVSLENNSSTAVAASRDNLASLYGVVVASGDLAISDTAASGQTVEVSKDGIVDTLVSDFQGSIKAGDPVTVNTVEGVGEKAVVSGKIIGIAQADFDGTGAGSRQFSVSDGNSSKDVRVGLIPVKVEVQLYSIASSGQGSLSTANRSKALQIADSLTGHTVKPYALIIAGILLAFGVLIAGFLVISSGYASMISLGRNPIAKKVILVSLMKILLVAVAICFVSASLAYTVLIIV